MITANWREWVSSDAWQAAGRGVLPAPPRAFNEFFWLASENDIDARRLIRLVAQDPVFTIRILRLANVAAFAPAGEVTSIEVAVVRLGTRAVRNAVLAACLSAWGQSVDAYGRRGLEEIQHAVGTACAARRIAERLRLVTDDAFVHGLLHDVGKLFLLKMRSEYLRLGGRPPAAEEFESVMADLHAEVGATALQLWGLPEPVRAAVRWHHEPLNPAAADSRAAAIVYVADQLSHRYGFGCPPSEERPAIQDDPVCLTLGLQNGWLERFDEDALNLSLSARQLVS
jgi:putative nucleotidyltransferase with HDIG domain